MSQRPFFEAGLSFECTRCSACCRHTPGFVFLSFADARRLAAHFGVTQGRFLSRYCRRVDLGVARRVSLKEKPNYDCIFWEAGGCAVYEQRPLQCRSFPFWSANLASRGDWEECGNRCPGVGRGPLHDRQEIEDWLASRQEEGFLEG